MWQPFPLNTSNCRKKLYNGPEIGVSITNILIQAGRFCLRRRTFFNGIIPSDGLCGCRGCAIINVLLNWPYIFEFLPARRTTIWSHSRSAISLSGKYPSGSIGFRTPRTKYRPRVHSADRRRGNGKNCASPADPAKAARLDARDIPPSIAVFLARTPDELVGESGH